MFLNFNAIIDGLQIRKQTNKKKTKQIGVKEFAQLCFDFGIELDDVTSEYEEIKREKGDDAPELANADKSVLYKIEIPGKMSFCV